MMVEALLVGGKEQVCEPTSPHLQLASAACHVGTKTPPLPSFTMPISHGACHQKVGAHCWGGGRSFEPRRQRNDEAVLLDAKGEEAVTDD